MTMRADSNSGAPPTARSLAVNIGPEKVEVMMNIQDS